MDVKSELKPRNKDSLNPCLTGLENLLHTMSIFDDWDEIEAEATKPIFDDWVIISHTEVGYVALI